MEKKIDIRKKYSIEVSDIENKLYQLGKKTTDDGEAETKINQIQEMLEELKEKIEYNKISDVELLQICYEKATNSMNYK